MNNPFIITSEYISPAFFCDREVETGILIDNIVNGRNTVLVSPRRMGKSGLISHVFNQEPIFSNFETFSIDLYSASSLAEMVLFLGRSISDRLKKDRQKRMESFFSFVQSLRPGFKVDPVTGAIGFEISLGEITRPKDSLEEIFSYLESARRPCVVAIDEFQQIAEFPENNVVETLRSLVQKCKNTLFIFSGSKRRMMDRLFNSPSEPFYMSCVPLYLERIDRETYCNFACSLFTLYSKSLDRQCFYDVYDRFEGHTWYVQRVMNELFARTDKGEQATFGAVADAVDFIVKLGTRGYEEQFVSFPSAQKQLLIAIAREGKAEQVTSIAFVKKHALKSPSTVQSALRVLYEKEIVTKEQGKYMITNRFFALWILRQYVSA